MKCAFWFMGICRIRFLFVWISILVPILAGAVPTLTSARRSFANQTKVTVVFSEAVSSATATNAANYSIDNGVVVNSVSIGTNTQTVMLLTSLIASGTNYVLTVNGVEDLFGHAIATNSTIALNLAPLVPAEVGTLVNGFQDDFDGPGRDAGWVPTPTGHDVYSVNSGLLHVGTSDGDPNHLEYQGANYNSTVQEILARIRVTAFDIRDGSLGNADAPRVGLGVGLDTVNGIGIDLLFRDCSCFISQPPFANRHVQFVNTSAAWGPGVDSTFTWQTNVWYWMRLRQATNSGAGQPDVFAKVWKADGDTPEPAAWQGSWDYYPASSARSGKAGIVAGSFSAPRSEYDVDYALVKASGLPSITVDPAATHQDGPILISARRSFSDHTQVAVTFSKPVSLGTATNASNYIINNGVSVLAAAMANQSTVVLTTTAIGDSLVHVLKVSGVTDLTAHSIRVNSPITIDITPLVPMDLGTVVSGFQDDFDGPTRDSNWVPVPAGHDVYAVNSGLLHVGTSDGDPNHLEYQAPGYDSTVQEILARIRVTAFDIRDGRLGNSDAPRVGLGVGLDTANGIGIDLLFRDCSCFISQPPFMNKHVQFVNTSVAWGPGVDSTFTWQTNVWYWMRLRQGPNAGAGQPDVFAKVWRADGDTPEPAAWQGSWDYYPASGLRSGKVGIVAGSYSAPRSEYDVDYVMIKAGGLPTITATSKTFAIGKASVTLQPQNLNGTAGGTGTFTVGANGTAPFSYQWLRNGAPIAGANGNSYTISPISSCDNGAVFSVVISNAFGSVTSSGATLTVVPDASLVNNLIGSLEVSNRVPLYSLESKAGQWYHVQGSTNLNDWTSLSKVYNTNGIVRLSDQQAVNFSQRFYRARVASPEPDFSFTYNGISSAQLLPAWTSNRTEVVLDSGRIQRSVVYGDPVTGLEVTLQATEYPDFQAMEWVLYFENKGTSDTPILEQVNAVDLNIKRGSAGEFTLYSAKGCSALITDFQPIEAQLATNSQLGFSAFGGRSSSENALPYFNVAKPEGGGQMVGIGWSGQWSASFTRDSATNLNIRGGMQLTHLRLHSGERIRTPSILTLQYDGNRLVGHNLFRRLLRQYFTPIAGGQPVVTPIAASPHGYISFNASTVTNMVQAITNIALNDFPVDTFWIDAGWYPFTNSWEYGNGNWFADPTRYPNGLRPVADAAHSNGMKFLVWFEMERVMPGTWLATNHPAWLLSPSGLPSNLAYQSTWRLLNLGNPDALAWAKSYFSQMLTDEGIDIYRIDFNMDPLYFWRNGEATDRQGITEIFYIMSLYDYFDTLRANHPNLIIDNCAGGGRRLDFEMARRSVPLLRTDYLWDPNGAQCAEYGLSFWLPYHGQGAVGLDSYSFRSGLGATAVYPYAFGVPNDPWWAIGTQRINEYKAVKKYFLGDFYPLTSFSTTNTVWLAYQFDRPDLNSGLVLSFRRDASDMSSVNLRLSGLDPNALYVVTNFDTLGTITMYGCDLMGQGLPVSIGVKPGAALFTYQKTP